MPTLIFEDSLPSGIHVGDTYVDISYRFRTSAGSPLPIDSGSTITFTFKNPSGTLVTTSGSVEDPDEGKVLCQITDETFFDEAGTWSFQVKVVLGEVTQRGAVRALEVSENLS